MTRARFWRRCRIYFRRFRIAVWVLVLALLGALIYLDQVGLPQFARKALVGQLRSHGLDFQFSRLRLRWFEGIVADNARLGRSEDPLGPHLTSRALEIRLNFKALARLQVQVEGLTLRQGRFVWPLAGAEQFPRQLSIDDIQTDLRFLPGDVWALDNFRAEFAGANIQLSGAVTNGLEYWKLFQSGQEHSASIWQARVRDLADTLERINFESAPELKVIFCGDARDPQSFEARLVLKAPGAETPWGAVSQGLFTARLSPASSNELERLEISLQSSQARTLWGAATNLHATMNLSAVSGDTNLVRGELTLDAEQLGVSGLGLSNGHITAHWVQTSTRPTPIFGGGELRGDHLGYAGWGEAGRVRILTRFAVSNIVATTDSTFLDILTQLQACNLDWDCRLSGVKSPLLPGLRGIESVAAWQAPELVVSNFTAQFDPGRVEVRGRVDMANRTARAEVTSDADPNLLLPILPDAARDGLAQLSWKKPPRLQAEAALTLPLWSILRPDWRSAWLPGLCLAGEFDFERGGAFRGVEVNAAHSHFAYSNQCWRLPDLTVIRQEGRIEAEHMANERTRDFHWRVRGAVDPNCLRPILEDAQERVLDLFVLTQPPEIEADILGRYKQPESTRVLARVGLTNFTFRGESIAGLQTALEYTNRVLRLEAPRLQRSEGSAGADSVTADFNQERVLLVNGFSTVDPVFVGKIIGPQVQRAIEPYRFDHPPAARVSGVAPMHGDEVADLQFEVEGGPFHWWKFNLPHIAGQAHWKGKQLRLSNVRADFYDGEASGEADFDFHPETGGQAQFSAVITNVLLQALMADLFAHTNLLEGRLSGKLDISHANLARMEGLEGQGNLQLRDGLIWDIPLFGIFTPVLDAIIPGLGSNRAGAANCSFAITNAVVFSDDLEVDAQGFRLLYRGTLDLEGRLNARVTAELLRDIWVIGPVAKWVLWPVSKVFEYKVTGTIEEPKSVPVTPVIPTVLQLPVHPIRTLKEFFPQGFGSSQTNALPARD